MTGLVLREPELRLVLSAYADDVLLVVQDPGDLARVEACQAIYSAASSARVNWIKSSGLAVGDWRQPTDFEELNEEYYKEYIMKTEARHDAGTKLAISNISKAQEKQQIQYAKTKTRKHGEITFKAKTEREVP
ncbi:unnamed protein product [Caretta caretta]